MELNKLNLKFNGKDTKLENQYQYENFVQNINVFRFALIVGVVLYGLFGYIDSITLGEDRYFNWQIRFKCSCSIGKYN